MLESNPERLTQSTEQNNSFSFLPCPSTWLRLRWGAFSFLEGVGGAKNQSFSALHRRSIHVDLFHFFLPVLSQRNCFVVNRRKLNPGRGISSTDPTVNFRLKTPLLNLHITTG